MTSSVPRVRRQRGLSLLEVLVAIVILSLGLLGMAGLQAASLRTSQGSFYRAQAAQYADDMAERMRANNRDATAYALALAATAPGSACTGVCARDINDWLARLRSLPGGDGSIVVDTVNETVTVTVQWDDSRGGGGTAATQTIVTRLWNNDR
ncbi:type IV pilus modification protein PilV [Betaproteobacteria bacterium PRO7]|jgi:type IV pilus assembly protein PilV|nr:type IV pilus modification protein PilV [Betaproteobacteria bacterium PRO7]